MTDKKNVKRARILVSANYRFSETRLGGKPEREAYNLDLARKVKAAVGCPVMVVGGFRSYEVAEKAIRDDGMDYISMARPLVREPGLPNPWSKGEYYEI